MKICYFGDYDPEYSRNRVIIRGLRQNGIDVVECNVQGKKLRRYWRLRRKLKRLRGRYDIVIVGYSETRLMVPFVQMLTRKPIVWDAFYSVYEARVFDRKKVSWKHPKGIVYYLSDWLACHAADMVLLDTEQHVRYFLQTFGGRREWHKKIWVGTDDSVFYPRERNAPSPENVLVHFHGKYIPLQGVEYIVRAAKILERHPDITFRLVGAGQTYKAVRALADELRLHNVEFVSRVPYERLATLMAEAHVCLGIVGDTKKTQRVIPNKVYEALAMQRAVITANTPAVRELLTNEKNVLFCRAADPQDIAEKILLLKNNSSLRESIAQGGYMAFREQATPNIIGNTLRGYLQTLL